MKKTSKQMLLTGAALALLGMTSSVSATGINQVDAQLKDLKKEAAPQTVNDVVAEYKAPKKEAAIKEATVEPIT